MFSKRHYDFLAAWLDNVAMAVGDLDRRLVAHSLADRLERDNPRFDRHRFLKAAGCGSTVVSFREAAE